MSTFGQVNTETTQQDVVLIENKRRQAKITVPNVRSKSIEEINLELHRRIIDTRHAVHGCCVLPDGEIALTNYHNGVRIINKYGSFNSDVRTAGYTYDVEYLNRDDILIVTSDGSSITLIDMKNKIIKKKVALDSVAYGKKQSQMMGLFILEETEESK